MFPEETTTRNRQRGPQSTRRRLKSPHNFSASPSRRRTPRPTPKPIQVFHKCYSAPMIFPDDNHSLDSDEGRWFGRVHTLDDIILCTGASPITQINTEYEKDAKVIIAVTVEGSPGAIKTVVRLGANVEDTIKVVIQKYEEEGRTPCLDKNKTCSYDLYVSYFSLQSLNKSCAIGDVGTRSFYLRKSSSSNKSDGCNRMAFVPNQATKQSTSTMAILPPFIAHKLNKLEKMMMMMMMMMSYI